MTRALKIVEYAVIALFVGISISYAVILLARGNPIQEEINNQLLVLQNSVDTATMSAFSDKVITGTQVIQYTNRFAAMYPVQIVTGERPEGFYTVMGITDPTSDTYVDGSLEFLGKVVKDDNGRIVAIQFVQKGCAIPEYDVNEAKAITEAIAMDKSLAEAQFKLDTVKYNNRDKFAQIRELKKQIENLKDKCIVLESKSMFDHLKLDYSIKSENDSMADVYNRLAILQSQVNEMQDLVDEYERLLSIGNIAEYPVVIEGSEGE